MIWNPKHFSWNKKKIARGTLFPRQKRNIFSAAKIWIFGFQHVSFFRPTDATIDAHNATSILNQNNHTTFHKFTRYVFVTPRLLLLYKFAYGNSIPEETNASLEDFGSFFFPEKHGIVVLYLCEVRRHFGFVWRESSLSSWRGYVLGVNEVAGGFWGVCGGGVMKLVVSFAFGD